MPIRKRKLPQQVVDFLRREAPKIERNLGKMQNIDHRGLDKRFRSTETRKPGGRVRLMRLGNKFPGTKAVVIKRTHDATAKETIDYVKAL